MAGESLGEDVFARCVLGELFEFCSLLWGGVVLFGVEVRTGEAGGVTRGDASVEARGCPGGVLLCGMET